MAEVGCLKDGCFQNLQVEGTIDGSIFVNNGINIVPVTLVPAASVIIYKQTHSGRLNLIPSVATSNDAYLIPIPTQIGETYRFAWSGIDKDGDNVQFQAPAANNWSMSGGILYFDTDQASAAGYLMQFPDETAGGSNPDDKFLITNPESFDITFTATTLTNYHMSGMIMSVDTARTGSIPFTDI